MIGCQHHNPFGKLWKAPLRGLQARLFALQVNVATPANMAAVVALVLAEPPARSAVGVPERSGARAAGDLDAVGEARPPGSPPVRPSSSARRAAEPEGLPRARAAAHRLTRVGSIGLIAGLPPLLLGTFTLTSPLGGAGAMQFPHFPFRVTRSGASHHSQTVTAAAPPP